MSLTPHICTICNCKGARKKVEGGYAHRRCLPNHREIKRQEGHARRFAPLIADLILEIEIEEYDQTPPDDGTPRTCWVGGNPFLHRRAAGLSALGKA